MSRDRREEILSAAFEEFAAKGYGAATIKSIARAAGLRSAALIYWYFPDKESLFREVLTSQIPVVRVISDAEEMMGLPLEEVLMRVGRAYLGPESVRMKSGLQLVVGEAIRNPEVAGVFVRNGPLRVVSFLESYFEKQIAEGTLRPHDTRAGARSFIGMLIPHLAGTLFLPTLGEGAPEGDEYLKTCVEIFVRGLGAE